MRVFPQTCVFFRTRGLCEGVARLLSVVFAPGARIAQLVRYGRALASTSSEDEGRVRAFRHEGMIPHSTPPTCRWQSTKERSVMTTVTVATVVAAPVAQVFDMFTDIEHVAQRVANIQKIEMLTVGGLRLGSRWLETRAMLGHQDTVEMEVTAFEQTARTRLPTTRPARGSMRCSRSSLLTARPVFKSSSSSRAMGFHPERWPPCGGRWPAQCAMSSARTSKT